MLCAAIICPSGLTQNVNYIWKVFAANELESDSFEQNFGIPSMFSTTTNWCSVSLLRSLPAIWLNGKFLFILFVHVNWKHFRWGRVCCAPFSIERCWWECSHWKSTYKRGRIVDTTVMKIKLNNRIKPDGNVVTSTHQIYILYWSAYCDRTMTHLGAETRLADTN